MKRSLLWIGLLGLLAVARPGATQADTAKQAFADGKTLLAKADFHGAMDAFARALQADRTNEQYFQHFAMVRQVLALRDLLETEQEADRWERAARGLHSFYIRERLFEEALALDKKIHARLNTASSAVLLAQTQLSMQRPAEAAAVLSALDNEKQTAASRALYGLTLVRQGRMKSARRVAGRIELPNGAGPGAIYRAARLQAAVGNSDAALELLVRCFESIAPSRLDSFKKHAEQCPDFAALASTPQFAEALQTQSKVPESKCSGGRSCAGCPMRRNCPGSRGQ